MELVGDTMKTKKFLVAYEPQNQGKNKGDFLAVVFENSKPCFLGLKSRKLWEVGLMVFIGKEISEKEVFKKLVDTGRSIENVDQSLKDIEIYLTSLQDFKIGNIIGVAEDASGKERFKLEKKAELGILSGPPVKLP